MMWTLCFGCFGDETACNQIVTVCFLKHIHTYNNSAHTKSTSKLSSELIFFCENWRLSLNGVKNVRHALQIAADEASKEIISAKLWQLFGQIPELMEAQNVPLTLENPILWPVLCESILHKRRLLSPPSIPIRGGKSILDIGCSTPKQNRTILGKFPRGNPSFPTHFFLFFLWPMAPFWWPEKTHNKEFFSSPSPKCYLFYCGTSFTNKKANWIELLRERDSAIRDNCGQRQCVPQGPVNKFKVRSLHREIH